MSFVTCALTGRLGNNVFQIMTTMAHAWRNGVDYKVPPAVRSSHIREHPFGYLPQLTKKDEANIGYNHAIDGWEYEPIPFKPNMRLRGWFQNYNYFHEYRERIIKEFSLFEIETDAIAVHYRAGDYRRYPTKHPMMPKEYYNEALSMFDSKEVHVFSDEPDTARGVIKGADVYHPIGDPFLDWATMATHKYHIIGNSTFSWTAAYLSGSDSVVMPDVSKWYGPGNSHIFTGGLKVPNWEQVKF